jgi:meiotic recombination protein REC8, fungi type
MRLWLGVSPQRLEAWERKYIMAWYAEGVHVLDSLLTRMQLGHRDEEGFMVSQDNDRALGTNVEPFPPPEYVQQETTSETAEAPARRRRKHVPKILAIDTTVELRNGDLSRWNTDYVANMHEALRQKQGTRALAIAKENAKIWVLGDGNLGSLARSDMLVRGPMEMFSGAKLIEALIGVNLLTGEKRTRDANDEGDGTSPKRARGLERASAEVGRGAFLNDEGFGVMAGDDYPGIEQGREAPTPLDDDNHLSSIFPWNQSTGSRRPTSIYHTVSMSGTGGTRPGVLSRRGSRLQTMSPLIGRGVPGVDSMGIAGLQSDTYTNLAGIDDIDMVDANDYERYGPAVQVDTQTAGQLQWQRAVLDSESINFLAFVQGAMEDAHASRNAARAGDEDDETLHDTIGFDVLLPPEQNTRIVAAQGLLHVLALGTKNMLQIEQEEAFGPIVMRAV